MQAMSINNAGNKYTITQTVLGVYTFKHIATNEVLHGQVGPWQEANLLYVEHSGIKDWQKTEFVAYDVGMGCGSQLFALYEAFLLNKKIQKLSIVSFDLEKEGLTTLKHNLEFFPHLQKYTCLLNQLLEKDFVLDTTSDNRLFEWHFIQGDFSTISDNALNPLPNADAICYDFFSPASHPHLWTLQLFSKLYAKTALEAKLITYSSATSVRAAMLAAGFYVGFGPYSGKKAKSTLAARKLNLLAEPLPEVWKQTFAASSAKFSAAETAQTLITERIAKHSQW